ncbi:MAG: lipopolysaccharide biosynthesis protein RfbH, partial [Planctomycetota bacterium]|nr:lipopolysaccharide biosynthesis protein RfbH [Planctomycetota bacterium]
MADNKNLRQQLLNKVKRFYKAMPKGKFIPGKTRINYAGRIYDEKELVNLVDASLDFWLTTGRYEKEFCKKLSNFLGVKYVITANSGSSANLLAIAALTSPKLGKRQLKRGDEVITLACGFPTTVTPIIQHGLMPVFADIELGTYNIDISRIERTITDRTKAIFIAHTLGIPFETDKILKIVNKYKLWFIEDNCDALGAKYKGRYTGTFGHIGTLSFYPAHHITTGEGGAVITNDHKLKTIVASFRDWGRDCWCDPGSDNTCGKRFKWQMGKLPHGYDHKYTYSHLGYNLKMTDMQAAV